MIDRRRTGATIAAAAGLSLAMAACGAASTSASKAASPAATSGTAAPAGGAATGSPGGVVLAASTRTLSDKTARMTLVETVRSGATSETVDGSGLVAFSGQEGDLTFTAASEGTFVVRVIGAQLYLQVPAAERSQLPSGKSWLGIDLNTVAESKFGASLSQLSSSSTQPTQLLSYLGSVSATGVHPAGTATIDGTATHAYRATVDLNKVAARRSPQAAAAVQKIEALLHRSTMPVEVWIDAADQVRQYRYQLPLPSTSSSPAGSVTATIGLSDFGVAVHVTAPPASQVDDVTSAASGG